MSYDETPQPIEYDDTSVPRHIKRKRDKDFREIQMWSSKKVKQSAESKPAHVGDKQLKKKIIRLNTENLLGFYDYICSKRHTEKDMIKYDNLQKLSNLIIEEADKRNIHTEVLNKINHKAQKQNEPTTEY